MLLRSALVGLVAAGAAITGCARQHGGTPPPRASVSADQARPAPEIRALCERSCGRLHECTPELSAAYEASPPDLGRRFVFACGDECDRLEGDARPQLARLEDCLSLHSCFAFYSCSTGEPLPASGVMAAPVRAAERSCAGLCAREVECRGDSRDRPSSDRVDECELACQTARAGSPDADTLLDCLSERTCGDLLGCTERWREGGYARQASAPPPGISETCDRLCTRAIRCGAEAEDLTDAEFSELRETMSSTYMECAVSCNRELRADNRAKFDRCLAVDDCAAFEKCAEAL